MTEGILGLPPDRRLAQPPCDTILLCLQAVCPAGAPSQQTTWLHSATLPSLATLTFASL